MSVKKWMEGRVRVQESTGGGVLGSVKLKVSVRTDETLAAL